MVRKMAAVALGAFALAALGGGTADAQDKCAGSKLKVTGKKAAGGGLGCYSKAAAKGLPVDSACLLKASGALTSGFSKAEAKGGCNTTGDAGDIQAKVDAFVLDVNSELYTSGEDKCAGSKLKATGKKAAGILGCHAKAATKNIPLDAACTAKVEGKFTTAFSKAEAKGGCNTTGDTADIEAKVDAFVLDVVSELVVAPTTTTTIPGGCDCCTDLPSLLSFTTGTPGGTATGNVAPAKCAQGTNNGADCTSDGDCTGGGLCRGHLDRGALYFGSGQPAGINLPATIPDLSISYTKIASCSGGEPVLTATVAGDIPAGCATPGGTPAQGDRHCTTAGCLFGVPLPIPNFGNPPTSTCIINRVATSASGTATCSTGATTLNLPLTSHVYLTGAILGTQTCALCTGGTVGVCGSGTCTGGSRNGMACTPESTSLTSHDCPPPAGTFIGDLPIPFALSTGTQTKTSFATGALPRVFCGFCFDPNVSSAFESPPHACDSDSDCTTGLFDSCKQHNNGAFRNPFATTITETGTTAGVCIDDGATHAATLVSVFCIPPSYDPIVDPSGELPGPGAVSLPGTAQFIP